MAPTVADRRGAGVERPCPFPALLPPVRSHMARMAAWWRSCTRRASAKATPGPGSLWPGQRFDDGRPQLRFELDEASPSNLTFLICSWAASAAF